MRRAGCIACGRSRHLHVSVDLPQQPLNNRLMLAVLLLTVALADPNAAALPTTAPTTPPTTSPANAPLPWRIAATREFALAIPLKWTPEPLNSPAAMLYLVREHLVDEYNQKMDAALTVERFPARRQTLAEGIKGMIDKARND